MGSQRVAHNLATKWLFIYLAALVSDVVHRNSVASCGFLHCILWVPSLHPVGFFLASCGFLPCILWVPPLHPVGSSIASCGLLPCFLWALSLLCTDSPVVLLCWLNCSEPYGILVPWPGIEPMSPALKCEIFTTGPSGKSLLSHCQVYILVMKHFLPE